MLNIHAYKQRGYFYLIITGRNMSNYILRLYNMRMRNSLQMWKQQQQQKQETKIRHMDDASGVSYLLKLSTLGSPSIFLGKDKYVKTNLHKKRPIQKHKFCCSMVLISEIVLFDFHISTSVFSSASGLVPLQFALRKPYKRLPLLKTRRASYWVAREKRLFIPSFSQSDGPFSFNLTLSPTRAPCAVE